MYAVRKLVFLSTLPYMILCQKSISRFTSHQAIYTDTEINRNRGRSTPEQNKQPLSRARKKQGRRYDVAHWEYLTKRIYHQYARTENAGNDGNTAAQKQTPVKMRSGTVERTNGSDRNEERNWVRHLWLFLNMASPWFGDAGCIVSFQYTP